MSLVDPAAVHPPWGLWAEVREVVGERAFDAATADWLPARAAAALAAAGPPDRKEWLYDGLWRLGVLREELLEELAAAGTPREFPLGDRHPPRHWRVLLEHWMPDGIGDQRSTHVATAFAQAWDSLGFSRVDDPRVARRLLSSVSRSQPLVVDWRHQPWIFGTSVAGRPVTITVDVPAILSSTDLDGLVGEEMDAVLWLLEQGPLPEEFDLRQLEETARKRVRELERGTVPTVTVDEARLRHERARRLVAHHFE
jgi:hypothetical protein